MKRVLVAALLPCLSAGVLSAAAAQTAPVLAQQPAVSATQVVFVFAGDLWSVPRVRRRGEAADDRRPASSRTRRSRPTGARSRSTAQYDGNVDVFVMPVAGRRAPAGDVAPRRRHGARLDAGRQEGAVLVAPHQLFAVPGAVPRRPRRRARREAAAADGLRGCVLAGRRPAGLRPAVAGVRRVEALSRRSGDAHLDCVARQQRRSRRSRARRPTTTRRRGSTTRSIS